MRTQHRNIAVHKVSEKNFRIDFTTYQSNTLKLFVNVRIYSEDESMGPPVNVKVQATVEGYLVTWEPPEFGKNLVRLYTVRWFRGPSEHLYGRAETTDTYYLGKRNLS